MHTPIIVVRLQNLFVLPSFVGTVSDNSVAEPHNFRGNRLLHVIDSSGVHWAATFERSNHSGVRRAFSATIKNISSDYYRCSMHPAITIGTFREIIRPKTSSEDPDVSDLASALLGSLDGVPAADPLGVHVRRLNL